MDKCNGKIINTYFSKHQLKKYQEHEKNAMFFNFSNRILKKEKRKKHSIQICCFTRHKAMFFRIPFEKLNQMTLVISYISNGKEAFLAVNENFADLKNVSLRLLSFGTFQFKIKNTKKIHNSPSVSHGFFNIENIAQQYYIFSGDKVSVEEVGDVCEDSGEDTELINYKPNRN
ncbi:hypothetical protein BpHYR1_053227 [Brachionus plicatilis]|uniref:Uncharacterized protein n=1 Tax=Brachionus plicatilis TaxID=10195 RepID=A0A3M7SHS6_BRAPC|nr:hypothetical protein BpHYR1_053227 [Brachionus plicatilis]